MCPHFQTTVAFGPGAAAHLEPAALAAHARLAGQMTTAMLAAGYDRAFMFIGDAWVAPTGAAAAETEALGTAAAFSAPLFSGGLAELLRAEAEAEACKATSPRVAPCA